MAAAGDENAAGGSRLNRFLASAIICVASLIVGVLIGFSLRFRAPIEGAPTDAPPTAAADTKEVADTAPSEVPPADAGIEASEAPEPGEPEGETEGETGVETEGETEGEPAGEIEVEVEPQPIRGELTAEVREMTGARSKTDIRAIAKRRGHEIERCIDDHGEGLDRVRHHYQISVTESGELSESLLLQGVRPELDTCVEQVLEGWSYGAADDASFFKLKLVWNAP